MYGRDHGQDEDICMEGSMLSCSLHNSLGSTLAAYLMYCSHVCSTLRVHQP
jgi:hypothetical protein